MKPGFVGCGAITAAMVTGLVRSAFPVSGIVVSPRSTEISARLAADFPVVSVAKDNQGVVDACDTVFLAVRPQVAEEVITELKFRPGQHVISVIATIPHEALERWIGVPVTLVRAIPLPFTADAMGATAVYPPDPVAKAIFSALGEAVEVDTIAGFELLAIASSMMGLYFGILEHSTGWLAGKGLKEADAAKYMRQLFAGLSQAALKAPDTSFAALREEFSTRGGLNEQVHRVFAENGGLDALSAGLESIEARIRTQAAPGEGPQIKA